MQKILRYTRPRTQACVRFLLPRHSGSLCKKMVPQTTEKPERKRRRIQPSSEDECESDGDGCAVIEALKSANIGVTEVSLRLLRVSVSGDELPVSLSGLCDVRGYVTAVGLEQRLRSACRAPLC